MHHCDPFIVCRETMCKEDDIDHNTPLMLFIYVRVLYGYASGTHLFLMLILQIHSSMSQSHCLL